MVAAAVVDGGGACDDVEGVEEVVVAYACHGQRLSLHGLAADIPKAYLHPYW